MTIDVLIQWSKNITRLPNTILPTLMLVSSRAVGCCGLARNGLMVTSAGSGFWFHHSQYYWMATVALSLAARSSKPVAGIKRTMSHHVGVFRPSGAFTFDMAKLKPSHPDCCGSTDCDKLRLQALSYHGTNNWNVIGTSDRGHKDWHWQLPLRIR